MTRRDALVPQCLTEIGCVTCGDEGVAMWVVEFDGAGGLALCADGDGTHSEVDLGLVAGVAPGDELLVHAGVALARLEPEAAR